MGIHLDNGLYLPNGVLNGGSVAAQGGVSGLGGVPGQLGKIVTLDDVMAAKLSRTTVGTLRMGQYMWVRFKSTSTTAPARGGLCHFSDIANRVVSPDFTSADEGKPYFVYVDTAPVKGEYGIVQVAGLASALFRGTVTDKTDGNLAIQLTTTNTLDAIAESTGTYISGGVKGLKNIFGTCEGAPSDGAISLVWMRSVFGLG